MIQMEELAMEEFGCSRLQPSRSFKWMRSYAIPPIYPGCSVCVIGRGKAMDVRSASWSTSATMPYGLPYSGPPDRLQPHHDYYLASNFRTDWPLSCQNSLTTHPLEYRPAGLVTGANRRRASSCTLYDCECTDHGISRRI